MQKIKDMQDKLECHDGQIEALETADKRKDVIIAEIQADLRHIIEKIDELSRRLEKFMERPK
jgi:chromosome segregation ATPase